MKKIKSGEKRLLNDLIKIGNDFQHKSTIPPDENKLY